MAIKKKENIHFECFLLTNSLIKKKKKAKKNQTKQNPKKKERKRKKPKPKPTKPNPLQFALDFVRKII